jgi:hypothetical protein
MVRIGILLTHPRQEKKKGELLGDVRSEWAQHAPRKYNFPKQEEEYGKYGLPTDVAIGSYIQHALKQKDVEVDFIEPKEISKERLRSNDLNFLLIYDVLEAFHTDKSIDKAVYNNLKKCLLGAKNVYPPREYQEFIYSKINYYNYLQEKKVSVLPTFTLTTEEYKKIGHDASLRKLLEFWDREKLGTVIAKPVYGQEGMNIEWFDKDDKEDVKRAEETCLHTSEDAPRNILVLLSRRWCMALATRRKALNCACTTWATSTSIPFAQAREEWAPMVLRNLA